MQKYNVNNVVDGGISVTQNKVSSDKTKIIMLKRCSVIILLNGILIIFIYLNILLKLYHNIS